MAKILLAAERKGGKISIRDAQLAFSSKFRPTTQVVRSWFGELVALGYGKVEKSGNGKSVIFENTSGSVDQLDQLPSNVFSTRDTATDPTDPALDQLDQLQAPTDPTDPELIQSWITSNPIQEEGLRPTDPTDPLIQHPLEKKENENENVTDCVEFIRTAISKNAPQTANCKTAAKLKIKFGGRFANNFLLVSIFV